MPSRTGAERVAAHRERRRRAGKRRLHVELRLDPDLLAELDALRAEGQSRVEVVRNLVTWSLELLALPEPDYEAVRKILDSAGVPGVPGRTEILD